MLMSTADGNVLPESVLAGRGTRTMAAGLERRETRLFFVVASCRLMASVTLRFPGYYPLFRESVPVLSARSHAALQAVGERTDRSGRNRHIYIYIYM
jgi:hypothetical protein